MNVAIMQPYFFPYIGYFSLINNVDLFVLLDEVQFMRHGWIERNRILKQGGGWQYVSIPLKKHAQKDAICDIRIDDSQNWRAKIMGQLSHYRWAPYYKEVKSLVERCIEGEWDNITQLDYHVLQCVCDYLEVNTQIIVFSEMHLEIDAVHAADEWALNICKALGNVTEYWNPPGGKSFFDVSKYEREGIKVCFPQMKECIYKQGRRENFEPWLSVIDVLMFNSIETVKEMMGQYTFI